MIKLKIEGNIKVYKLIYILTHDYHHGTLQMNHYNVLGLAQSRNNNNKYFSRVK